MNITAIAKLPSRGSLPEAIYSGRNSPRAPGQRATTSRRSARGTSSAMLFQNSDMMAVGKPSAGELALLESFRGKVPDEVFGEPFVPPVSDGSGQDRALLRKASALLQEAGFVIKDGKRVTLQGEPIIVEFLIDEPSFQPHH